MLIFSSTILTCPFEAKCLQLLLSSIFNSLIIIESESRENTKSFNVTCKGHNFTGVIADNAVLGQVHHVFLSIFTCRFWDSSQARKDTGEPLLDSYV